MRHSSSCRPARYREDLVEWQRMMFCRRPLNLPIDFGN